MDSIFVIRGRLQELYASHSRIFDKAVQFIVALAAFYLINDNVGFLSAAASPVATLARSIICTFFPPIITVLAPLVVDLMIGSLVIEKIFSIPGIGSLMIAAIQSNDYNVTISLAFIYSVMYIVLMLVVDVLYGIIDPRIRLAKKSD